MSASQLHFLAVAINGKKVELNKGNNFEDIQSFDNLNVTTNKYRQVRFSSSINSYLKRLSGLS